MVHRDEDLTCDPFQDLQQAGADAAVRRQFEVTGAVGVDGKDTDVIAESPRIDEALVAGPFEGTDPHAAVGGQPPDLGVVEILNVNVGTAFPVLQESQVAAVGRQGVLGALRAAQEILDGDQRRFGLLRALAATRHAHGNKSGQSHSAERRSQSPLDADRQDHRCPPFADPPARNPFGDRSSARSIFRRDSFHPGGYHADRCLSCREPVSRHIANRFSTGAGRKACRTTPVNRRGRSCLELVFPAGRGKLDTHQAAVFSNIAQPVPNPGGLMAADETSSDTALIPPDQWNEEYWREHVYQGRRLGELTPRAVIVGCLIGILLVAVNIYMGLKTGFGEGGSIIAAIMGLVIFRAFRARYSMLENNITQTAGSAAGSIGNIVNVVPAFVIMAAAGTIARPMLWWQILLFVFATSLLGVFFAIPLRKQVVVEEKLRFPSGTACAEIMRSLHGKGEEARKHGGVLGCFLLVSALIKWLQEGLPRVISGMSLQAGQWAGMASQRLLLGIAWDPLLLGAGFLVGPRIGISLLLGAIVAWPVMGPIVVHNGWIPAGLEEAGYTDIMAWTMWPGVMLMISAGLTALLMKWKVVLGTFRSMLAIGRGGAADALELSFRAWITWLLVSVIICVVVMQLGFNIPWWLTLMSVALSFIMAAIAVRCIGQTEVNPVSAFASMNQLIVGAIMPANITANLTMAGVAGAGASEAGDMMQDLKTGWLVGATPKRQVFTQIIGVLVGSAVAVPMLLLIFNTYELGTAAMPAPAAFRFAALADLFARGFEALPPYTITAMVLATALGVVLGALESFPRLRSWIPSPVGMGVAMIIPFSYSFAIFLGSAVYFVLRLAMPKQMSEYQFVIGAAGIAGSSLMGMLIALLIWLGMPG
ncbi:MAG: OPT family oligopeptide transporter [Candidatus Eisenbacteria bacterium]|nr:OPT family oligopeptide transporter [Candidatus Eisenbacteria bacterium]